MKRNLVKRRLRNLIRVYLLPTEIRADFVVRIRPEAYDASFSVLMTEILTVRDRLQHWDNARPDLRGTNS